MTRLRLIAIISFCFALFAAAGAEAGAPSPGSPWTKREYVDFYFSHYNGNLALPHLREPAAKAVFERIVNPENVLRILASAESIDEKQRQITTVLSVIGEIRAAYGYAVLVGEPLQEELTRVQAFTLDVLDSAIRIDARRDDAWRTTFFGIVESLSERSRYSSRQIATLATALAAHYPAIGRILADADRRDFRNRVGRLAAIEGDPTVRTAYTQLLRVSKGFELR
jgi:hypothetical protein